MNLEGKLELMELADQFTITKQTHDDGGLVSVTYTVEPKEEPDEYPVIAKYIDGGWRYFVSGVCGCNLAEINMDQVQALQDLIQRLTGVE